VDKFRELKAAAMAATPGPWSYSRSGFNAIVQTSVTLPRGGSSRVVLCKLFRSEWRSELKTAHDAAFIAAANPAVVLELLADNEHLARELVARNGENEWLRKRAAELEHANKSQDDHINQQQDRIDSLEKTNAGLGRRLGDAEKRLATPVRLLDARTERDYEQTEKWNGPDPYCMGHLDGWNANRLEQAALLKKQGFKVEGDE